MITKDIGLEDCILDLLDNSIDGARQKLQQMGGSADTDRPYTGFFADVRFDAEAFEIEDNCGGIPLEEAEHYAFHFGRRPDADPEADYAIGLYGIGMKRAIFKMGRRATVRSSTETEAFEVVIDVDEWLARPDQGDWDFQLDVLDPWTPAGTKVTVHRLWPGVAAEFTDAEFAAGLKDIVARDYSLFLQMGFRISINGSEVRPFEFQLKWLEGEIEPINHTFEEGGVEVRLIAGMASLPQDDTEPEDIENVDPAYYGWFVLCNDRVVLAADKTSKTVWGNGLPNWHPQYNGFVGVASFRSADPSRLPWTTTKRGIEVSDPLYRRVVSEMRKVTRPYLDYTNLRKAHLRHAKAIEARADARSIRDLPARLEMVLPELPAVERRRMARISFQRPKEEVQKLKDAIGDPDMSNRDLGIMAYERLLKAYAGG
jgi:hypothetical protein